MVNAGRVACIFTPFVLSLGALVCIVLVFLGGTSSSTAWLDQFYFLKLDLSNFTVNGALANTGSSAATTALENALQNAKQDLNLQDYYSINLLNYCAWNGQDEYSFCSARQAYFWFNPITVWGLNSTGIDVDSLLPTDLKTGLNDYKTVSKWLFFTYVFALGSTAATILVGISAIFSRWGSFFTTFFANAATVLLIASSIIATVLFTALDATVKAAFKDYGITASLGQPLLRATWLGVAFSLAAGFFWLLSVCCCSGRSPYHKNRDDKRRVRVEKTPYTYERVGSPYLGPQGDQAVPLSNLGNARNTAYEPFRPQQV